MQSSFPGTWPDRPQNEPLDFLLAWFSCKKPYCFFFSDLPKPPNRLRHYVLKLWLHFLREKSSRPGMKSECLPLRFLLCSAAAKSCQLCPTLCNPTDGRPPGSPVPGIHQARIPEWVAISFSNAWKGKVKVKSLIRVQLFPTSWTASHQGPPSMGFSRQEYCSGVPSPSPLLCSGWLANIPRDEWNQAH